MARFNRLTSGSRRSREEDTELNIVPIMNMFMVLIPFLLMSASFFQIKAINTSVAVHSNSPKSENSSPPEKVTHKLTVILELREDLIKISALSDTLGPEILADLKTEITRPGGQALSVTSIAEHLNKLKIRYPLSDTMLLIPDAEVSYNDIIQAMDCARKYQEKVLFPNVVLSASLG
jgi:biopolymer transport protein ExbD